MIPSLLVLHNSLLQMLSIKPYLGGHMYSYPFLKTDSAVPSLSFFCNGPSLCFAKASLCLSQAISFNCFNVNVPSDFFISRTQMLNNILFLSPVQPSCNTFCMHGGYSL